MIAEARRAPRRQVPDMVPVLDMMEDAVVGRLGNVSENGMLLLASAPLHEDALYQLRFAMPHAGREVQIDVGVHLLWSERAHAPGQAWAGFRFLTIAPAHRELLRLWINAGPAG
ncbi:PilZ domain-containing protein [Xanthomonas hyacinthi]|uniref:PilZ domain-containing protein n=1 Tax=Xanthomonas hyacinthi TaxID=56455 RepID=A0A2S7EZX9_9XANT|nr:PilZ domain-containing protein [Xanthomonas hyacinthi]KLD78325.1 pilus assembly protein PilZ [Xanthomonas hyacinthi DSM 19077]PPU98723.1 PilZ domain-containing protein [Xanthomonas hyacinthi]QGY77543.1 PilZ domain-containing protein [Xanthomonas hyacinthi]